MHFICTCITTDSGFVSCTGTLSGYRSGNVRLVWVWLKGAATTENSHSQFFTNSTLNYLSICLFSILPSLNKGVTCVERRWDQTFPLSSLGCHIVTWSWQWCSKSSRIPLYPSATYRDLGETCERQPHDTTHSPNRWKTSVRSWYTWKRIKRVQGGKQYIKKRKTGGHICLWKGKNVALKITSREIIYHCSLYHFFWQRQMAWSQIGSLMALFGFFVLACCMFWVRSHTYAHSFTHTYTEGEWQLAVSAKWTSAFNNELTSFEHMIIAETGINSMNACEVVNLSSNSLKGIFRWVFIGSRIYWLFVWDKL